MTPARPYLDLDFASAIEAERRYQDAKWGPINDRDHDWAEWALILNREVGEANDALGRLHWFDAPWNDAGQLAEARSELIQVAAVCAAVLELIEVYDIPNGTPEADS